MVDAVRRDEELWARLCRDTGQIDAQRVHGAVIRLPFGLPRADAACIFDLVQQHVAARSHLGHDVKRRGVAADDDDAIRCREPVAVALQRPVADREGLDPHAIVLVDDAGRDLRRLDPVADLVGALKAVQPEVDVRSVGGEDVLRHGADAPGPKDLERLRALEHPGREDQVGIAGRMIRVQMGAEGVAEQIGAQRVDAREIGLGGLAHDAGAKIDQIGPVPDDDGAGRAAGIGAGVGRARAEQDELRFEFLHIRRFPLPA